MLAKTVPGRLRVVCAVVAAVGGQREEGPRRRGRGTVLDAGRGQLERVDEDDSLQLLHQIPAADVIGTILPPIANLQTQVVLKTFRKLQHKLPN
jgi:hypothetical protein